jgi:O-antigen/teichoic acid export membrane protein
LYAGAQFLALLFTATIFLTWTSRRTRGAPPSYNVAVWLRSMARFAVAGGLMIADGQIFALVLGTFASETQVGLFRIAQRAAGLANLGLLAIGRVLGPHLGQSFARGDNERLQKLVTRGAQAMAGSALVVLIGFALLGGELLELAAGPDFRPAYLPLVILSFGTFVQASFGPFEMLMNMTHQEGTIIRARAIAMVVAVTTAIALMGENAAVEAAAASALGMVVLAVMLWRDARRRLGCRTSALGL